MGGQASKTPQGPLTAPEEKKAKTEQTAAWVFFIMALLVIMAIVGMMLTGWRPFASAD